MAFLIIDRAGSRVEFRRHGLFRRRKRHAILDGFLVARLRGFNLDPDWPSRGFALDDVYAALKLVWASPFTYRSFSWRQTLIDEPLWVLPSVVILESVPTSKSGVLVTADLDADRPRSLQVNADVRTGDLAVEVLTESGEVLEGFGD